MVGPGVRCFSVAEGRSGRDRAKIGGLLIGSAPISSDSPLSSACTHRPVWKLEGNCGGAATWHLCQHGYCAISRLPVFAKRPDSISRGLFSFRATFAGGTVTEKRTISYGPQSDVLHRRQKASARSCQCAETGRFLLSATHGRRPRYPALLRTASLPSEPGQHPQHHIGVPAGHIRPGSGYLLDTSCLTWGTC